MGCRLVFTDKLDLLKNKFDIEVLADDKIFVSAVVLPSVLKFLKETPEFGYDMLTSVIANDLCGCFELIYVLYSSTLFDTIKVAIRVNSSAHSVVDVFKSAHFDECEIFDMFGINFVGNEKLKRLFMPESWIGHPMRKDYVLDDKRLVWNE